MDPYLKLKCQGEMLNTETFMRGGKAEHRKRATVDPMWYFTWEADLSMPRRELQTYFPQVRFWFKFGSILVLYWFWFGFGSGFRFIFRCGFTLEWYMHGIV